MSNTISESKQRRREWLGLVVFCIAIFGIISAVISYMIVGHSFDLAASNIDDNVGQLEGYCSIVFDGNNSPANMKSSDKNFVYDLAEDILNPIADQSSFDASTTPATISNVSDLYKSKEACVINIKSCDYSAYSQGQIFDRDNWRVGVLSIDETTLNSALASKKAQIDKEEKEKQASASSTDASAKKDSKKDASTQQSPTSKSVKQKTPEMKALQDKITNLKKNNKADLIVVTAPNQDALDVLEGVDCLISLKVKSDIGIEGKQVNSTYVIPVPVAGSVSTVLSTPAKMLSGHNYKKFNK